MLSAIQTAYPSQKQFFRTHFGFLRWNQIVLKIESLCVVDECKGMGLNATSNTLDNIAADSLTSGDARHVRDSKLPPLLVTEIPVVWAKI